MEWVEVQGKTIELAVEVAMGELGVANRDDVDVEIIQEPKPGFLGVGGKEAIVKVTKAPSQRRRRRGGRGRSGNGRGNEARGNDGGTPSSQKAGSDKGASRSQKGRPREGSPRGTNDQQREEKKVANHEDRKQRPNEEPRPEQRPIEEQAEVAKGFIEGLLTSFGLEGTVSTRIEDDVLYLDVQGEQTEALVGQKGAVMQSVLELTRTVVQRKTYGAPRMRIDIAGYGERRREALRIYATKLSTQVIEDKGEVMLEPMNAADRKVLHDAVAEIDGVRSYSEGEEPRRSVVIAYDGED
jgi:spoIIIJ-associated protein